MHETGRIRRVTGILEGTDPTEGDSQTMLLGRIFHFDSPLSFDGSPVKRHIHHSMGEVRLARPGNKTEMGGSERWERVLQYPFELILRGVLKYQLPVSSRMQSAAIGASVYVHPEEGVDHKGAMRIEIPDNKDLWQWVELGDAEDDVGRAGHRPRRNCDNASRSHVQRRLGIRIRGRTSLTMPSHRHSRLGSHPC